MFNGEKLKELERRIKNLEKGCGSRINVFPGEDYFGVRCSEDPQVSAREAIRRICIHLGLEFKRTPETLELVTTKKK